FPLIIYTIIKSGTQKLKSNLKFYKLFRNPSRIQGKEEYYLTTFMASVKFIDEMNEDDATKVDDGGSKFFRCIVFEKPKPKRGNYEETDTEDRPCFRPDNYNDDVHLLRRMRKRPRSARGQRGWRADGDIHGYAYRDAVSDTDAGAGAEGVLIFGAVCAGGKI
ncbi:MAG: hypothetical protein J5532_06730, partial [Lachnospiraceae bacterium]|nr:hypothetical protein [Lachnospiraceae bacterium]